MKLVLPSEVMDLLTTTYTLANVEDYKRNLNLKLASMQNTSAPFTLQYVASKVIWATDSYKDLDFSFQDEISSFDHVQFRHKKNAVDAKKRVKQRAEVFTPSWVCNLQVNLVDDAVLQYKNAFNVEDENNRKQWTPTKKKIKFPKGYSWINYVTEKRLEMTCGEGPYLVSPYDTVTGAVIPVRDEKKRFARIGILDRKLRVAFENTSNVEDWKNAAYYAFRATYGYDWQGDNLVLARVNFLNTYIEYLRELWNTEPTTEELVKFAEVISWNLFQMDGLKMVAPESCTDACVACLKKTRGGHDGRLALVRFGSEVKTFEDLGPVDWFPVKITQKQSNSLF